MTPNVMLLPAAWIYGAVQRWDRRRKEVHQRITSARPRNLRRSEALLSAFA